MGNEQADRRVLVVDDEPMVREVVTRYLEHDGFLVTAVEDGRAALKAVKTSAPDLIVLDIMLPEIDGLDVLTQLRLSGDIPIILLTARTSEADRILGLELGADDYVLKPFSPRELTARVRSVLRRSAREPGGKRLEFEGLEINPATREVKVDGELAELTAREFDLLAFLAGSPRQVFSRAQLLSQVWESSPEWQDPATVTVHVRRVRQKIERDPDNPQRLVTVRGVGYRFEP
ncbi:MAG: response regulator transcription factor [Acidimicrobiia bacterium]|nr:response regulator transcription factor [Acidimicrobiia bacterium]